MFTVSEFKLTEIGVPILCCEETESKDSQKRYNVSNAFHSVMSISRVTQGNTFLQNRTSHEKF